MDAGARAAKRDLERDWWLRLLAVFQSPRPVFAAMRDDSNEEAAARQEPILLVLIMAAVAAILTSPTTGTLMDHDERDGLLVAVLVFVGALLYGTATYWLGGAIVYLGIRGAGSSGSYRRARHVLGYAAAPVALSLLVVWPVELAVYGGDLFRTGGADSGGDFVVFQVVEGAFVLWSFALLAIGIAEVEEWKLVRALGAIGLAAFALVGLAVLPALL